MYFSSRAPGHVTQFWEKWVKGQGQTGTKCIQLECAISQYWMILSSSYFSYLGANL